MIDKALAVQLRISGLKYNEIATTLHCSVAWCKKNLKGVGPSSEPALPTRDDVCNRILILVEQLRCL